MKKTFLLFLATSGLLLLNSCQNELLETNAEDFQLVQKAIPVEDEDIEQYINNDEMYPKAPVTKELLEAIAAYQAEESSTTHVYNRTGCDVSCADVPGSVLFCENFDDLKQGDVADACNNIEKWYPPAQNDGKIVSGHPDKFLKIDRKLQVPNSLNEVDDILVLEDANQGTYHLHFQMYIGPGRTGYFDLQKVLRTDVVAAFIFEKHGKAYAEMPNGEKVNFDYPVGEWFDIDVEFNVNNRPFNPTPPFNMIVVENENMLSIDIADQRIGMMSIAQEAVEDEEAKMNQMQGVDFYPMFRSSKFYVDNICFTYLGDPAIGE